jgi:hypothetical protein
MVQFFVAAERGEVPAGNGLTVDALRCRQQGNRPPSPR